MSAATRAASLIIGLLAIAVTAKAVQGGGKEPDKSEDKKAPTPPVTLPTDPDPGDDNRKKPFPIRTG